MEFSSGDREGLLIVAGWILGVASKGWIVCWRWVGKEEKGGVNMVSGGEIFNEFEETIN